MRSSGKSIGEYFRERGVSPKGMLLWLVAVAVLAGVCLVFGGMSQNKEPVFPVYISEVLAANTSYPNPQGRCCDLIEIHNSADYAVDLSGFQLGDIEGKSRYAFPAGTVMEPGAYLCVYCDKTPGAENCASFEIARAGGEVFYLIAKNGAVVDSVTTLPMDTDESMIRQADHSWTVSYVATPGAANGDYTAGNRDVYNSGVSPVRFTEIATCQSGYLPQWGVACDWVELHNTAQEAVDLSGFVLSDNVGNDKYVFPAGTVLEGDGYLVVCCTQQVAAPEVAPFGLRQDLEENLVLKTADGRIVELVQTMPMSGGSMALQADGSWSLTDAVSAGYENTAAGHAAYLEQTGAQAGSIRVSEVMADEQWVLADSQGRFSDWVELHNTTDRAIDLSGWYLTDDPAQPQKWMIPSLVLQPGEYRVIFCSGEDRTVSDELHAGFSLSAAGESLTLYAHGGVAVDSVNFPASQENRAFVFENGEAVLTDQPTPGYENTQQGYEAFCEAALPQGKLAIWEVMTANDRYLPQLLGNCYDWVELRNISDEPLDLSGFYLSDDPDVPQMHQLRSRTLQPGASVVIILSGEPDMARNGYEHAQFSLDAQVDQLFLFDGDGELVDFVHLENIPRGMSYGRTEGRGGFFQMEPSPENPNHAGCRQQSDAVESSHAPGVYSSDTAFTVTLQGAGPVYYTTDGSVPDGDSLLYTQPLRLEQTTVLRAVAMEEGKTPSDVYTATFVVGDTHQLPVVSLVTDPDGLWGTNGIYRNGDASVKEIKLASNVAYSGPDGEFSLDCAMNLHGDTTVTAFDKKSFALRFLDSYDGALHYDVFEDGEVTSFRSLILRTSHENIYSSQMHDVLMAHVANLGSENVITQKYKYVALYLNGEYWGLYAIRERHSQEHYASYQDVPADTVVIHRYLFDGDDTLNDLYNFVSTHSLKDPDNYAWVKTVLDVESFADWMIYEAYVCNIDIYANIRYYMSPEDGLWRMGLADLDLGMMGRSNAFEEIYGTFHHSILIQSLMGNEEFQDLLATRLATLLAGPLSDENMVKTIEEIAAIIRPEAQWEQERWGTPVSGWESTVDYMIRFCDGRAEQMINSLCGMLGFTQQEREYYFGSLE